MHAGQPVFDGGAMREHDGTRFFVRLWPRPVFLREDHSGAWRVVEDVCDDFNLSVLVEARDRLAPRFALDYPALTASVVQGQVFMEHVALPPELQPLLRLQRRIEARERALRVIPADLLNLVRRFPEAHFDLLQLFATFPETVELAETNPVMAYLLATSGCGLSNDIQRVLRSKRTAILQWLGFHATNKGLVRLLGKVQPWACRRELVSARQPALQDEETTKRLRHLPTINLGCLAIATDKSWLSRVSAGFLREVVADRREDLRKVTASKLHACLLLENRGCLYGLPAVFHARSKLESVLVAGAEHMSPEEIEALNIDPAPPPVPDSDHIQALRTAEEVYTEGCEQGNCVWTILPRLVTGRLFLYRVLWPERATLAIQSSCHGYRIHELEGTWNSPVSTETQEAVQQWLNTASVARRRRDDQLLLADHEEAE